MTPASSPAPSIHVFLRLVRMLRPYRGRIILALAMLFLAVPAELFPALVWKYVVDDIALQKGSPSSFLHYCFSLGGLLSDRFALLGSALVWLYVIYLYGELLGTLQTNLLSRVAQHFILGFRNRVYDKLQHQSMAYLQRNRTGDLMSRAMGDVDELNSFIVNGIDQIIGEAVLWAATVAIVMYMDWRVASISLAPLIVVYFLLRVFNRKIAPIYKASRERAGDVAARLQENLAGVVVIKIFAREKEEADRFRDSTTAAYDTQIKAVNARSLFFPFSRAIGFFSNVFMIGVGGFFMLKDGSFTPGQLIAFRAYWWRLFGPIQTLARVNDMIQRAVAAARRVFEVLDAPDELPDRPDARPLTQTRGHLRLDAVSFAYPADPGKTAPAVLNNVTLDIPPGVCVGLCGPSGAGKSTVLNLLLRFYDPAAGRVTLDDIDLASVRRDTLRRHFALVQQETFLFNDSILDNIRYGMPDATMDQVTAAAHAANAHAFISRLPDGYNTKVGERGIRLSGGQKQRISIARAFLADPRILLLDEPTSSVEPDSEAIIIAALGRLMKGRTTVLTSHRPSLIAQAQRIYVIDNGQIAATGTVDSLTRENPWFARFMSATLEDETTPVSAR